MSALINFLIVALIILVVVWVFKIVLDMLEFPPEIKKVVLLILALVALIILLFAALNVFNGNWTIIRIG